MSELTFCTSDQLIQELLNRMTFVGVLVHSENEATGVNSTHKSFVVNSSPTLDQRQVIAILEGLVCQMKNSA